MFYSLKNQSFYLLLIFVLILPSACQKKEGESSSENSVEGPADWLSWKNKAEERFKEKFAVPTITHHIYLDKKGDSAWIDLSGSYPRFVKEKCEKCVEQIIRRDLDRVELVSQKQTLDLPLEKQTAVFRSETLFLSPHKSEEDQQIRVFIYDLSQKKLKEKRERHFFNYDKNYRQIVEFSWLDQKLPVVIQRSDGSQKTFEKIAELKFKNGTEEEVLSVYNYSKGNEYLKDSQTMLLFRDFSNGQSTYGAGRFLNVDFKKQMGELKNKENLILDFNYAYNPPCAFSTGFHCPLPQDLIHRKIEVGEKSSKKK